MKDTPKADAFRGVFDLFVLGATASAASAARASVGTANAFLATFLGFTYIESCQSDNNC